MQRILFENPILAIAGLLILAASPLLAVLGGLRIGRLLAPSDGDLLQVPYREIVSFLTVTGGLLGTVFASFLPTPTTLGPQIQTAPLSRASQIFYVAVVPLLVVASLLLGLALCFLIPFTASWPSRTSSLELVLAIGLAAAFGALVVEGSIAALRRSWSGTVYVVSGIGLWCATGYLSSQPMALGPCGLLVDRLSRRSPELLSLGLIATVQALSVGLWLLAAAGRPLEPTPAIVRRSFMPVRSPWTLAVLRSALIQVARRRETRRHVGAVLVLTVVAVLLFGRQGESATTVGALLGLVTALFGVAMLPLSGGSSYSAASWYWKSVGRSTLGTALSYFLALVSLGLLLFTAIALATTLVTPLGIEDALQVWLAAILCFSLALLVGSLVHWRRDSTGAQVASYGTLLLAIAGVQILITRADSALNLRLREVNIWSVLILGLIASAAVFGSVIVTNQRG